MQEDVTNEATEGPTHIQAQVQQLQLRTPSPSVADSASAAPGGRHPSEALAPVLETIRPLLEPSPEALTALVSSIPTKTLHTYTLAQIPTSPQPVLDALATFFATLTPPPRLHCVRCHKDYVEVENDDRSCLVPHDDESAEVERVGRSGHERRTNEGTEYETLWGCCGKTTEGDGSQGPPDGWCYEGKHTTDIKRARFRADSTLQDDKLVSCLRLNCHGIRAHMPREANTRKRARKTYREASSEENDSAGASDSGVDEIAGRARSTKHETTAQLKRKSKSKQRADDPMDVDPSHEEGVSVAGGAGKGKEKEQDAPPAPPKRPRGRARKSIPTADAEGSPSVSARAPKRRGRQPKTAAVLEDSERETSRGRGTASPVRRETELPRTRSLSRTRAAEEEATRGAGRPGHKPKSRSRTKMAEVVCGVRSDSGEADDEQPKKKRKLGVA
ncbi:uncharacterized protein PHACADRAFT_85695 [Phanerochaete carnosa HHB-10118-sp]|uniref:Uncharacterized protein n=1 Tax=Phanerochaete carnosa (strain HHB-10118-sp) TaxID=650164 RepID=K5WLE4_PHACS|nr:uncharacterized protein PHACADRAFT_85695 [Phanerochaete carnosa HHB-10118-sp]EKM60004.1 hypothetical protein PHACADRAFT_85695 [Phanerochaete carnosa HHB-10118-sp]